MTKAEASAVCEQVLSLCEGDARVSVSAAGEELLRLANNQPIAHVNAERVTVQLGLRTGRRYGESRCQGTDRQSLQRLVEQARQQGDLLAEAPDVLPTVGPQEFQPGADCPAASSPEDLAAAAEAMLQAPTGAGLTCAGIVAVYRETVAMATTNGMRGAHHSVWLNADLTAMSDDSSGQAAQWTRAAGELDATALGQAAAESALRSKSPVGLEPGTYRVGLSAAAVGDLVRSYVGYGFNARSVREGRSWVATRRNERVAAPVINLAQDPGDARLAARPFDGEGCALRRVDLLRDGVVADLLYDRSAALAENQPVTGYAQGGRSQQGAWPSAVVMAGGTASREELLEAVGDGVWIDKVWYTNWVDPAACVVTGMTRDAFYRVRGGRLAEPLLHMRFSQSVLDLLAGVELLGQGLLRPGQVMPALVSTNINLASGTSF